MSVDPSKIKLKGLFLDLGNTVGGTREVFNNGVMCAKFYAGFSYAAPEGDTSTVSDIVNWLLDNASLRTCANNQTDNGVPSDFGWTSHGNTDPNGGKYVYDTQVVVPDNNEDYSQMPGNSVWHYAYFLQPSEGNTTPINVYLTFDYTDAQGNTNTMSSLSDTLLTVQLTEWVFETSDFEYVQQTGAIAVIRYREGLTTDSGVCRIHEWTNPPHLNVDPCAGTSSGNVGPFSASSLNSADITYDRVFFIIGYDDKNHKTLALVDKNAPIEFNGKSNHIDLPYNVLCLFAPADYLWNYNFETHDSSGVDVNGVWIAWWGEGDNPPKYFEGYDDNGIYLGYPGGLNPGATITIDAVDGFGQKIAISISYSDVYLQNISLNSVIKA